MTVDAVHVWLIDTDLPAPALAVLARLLDEEEGQRADALPPGARRRFIAAHGAIRLLVGARLGAPPELLRWGHGRHGKPELTGAWTGLQVNLSHSGTFAMVALTDRRPVGVDLERLTGNRDILGLAARYFPECELRYVTAAGGAAAQRDRYARLWVRKEACVKAVGGRLPQGLAVPVATTGTVLLRSQAGAAPEQVRVRDAAAPWGFRAAVALAGPDPYRLVRRRWRPPVG